MAILEGTAYWVSATTPNTTFEPVYSVNLVVADDVAEKFQQEGFTIKQMDEGPAIVIKRKVNGGSQAKVQYKAWESQWKGKTFKGLDFQAMQVLSLVEVGSPDGAEFDSFDDADMEGEF